jgi:chorismate dehydratase
MITIGFINYLNSQPLFYGLKQPNLKLVTAEPKRLAKMLTAGEIDFGQISAYEYLKAQDNFVLYDKFCVAAHKDCIGSVLLLTRLPINQLDGQSVLLTERSSTSSELLKILLKEYFKIQPNYFAFNCDYTDLKEVSAAMLIGDRALMAWQEKQVGKLGDWHVYDLAQLWFEWTGYPFVFAVFVGQKGLKLPQTLSKAIWENSQKIEAVIRANTGAQYTYQTLQNYYKQISYELSPNRINSLQKFRLVALPESTEFPVEKILL